MVVYRSQAKSDNAKLIKRYWETTREEGGGILHDILQDRIVEDVDVLWCLSQAMHERDADAIIICGYILSFDDEYERRTHLNDILGFVTS